MLMSFVNREMCQEGSDSLVKHCVKVSRVQLCNKISSPYEAALAQHLFQKEWPEQSVNAVTVLIIIDILKVFFKFWWNCLVYGLVFKVASVSRDQSKKMSTDGLEPQNLKQKRSLESLGCLYSGLHIIQLQRGRADTCQDFFPDLLKYENKFQIWDFGLGPFAVATVYSCGRAVTERQRLHGGVIIHSYNAGIGKMLVRLLSSCVHTV